MTLLRRSVLIPLLIAAVLGGGAGVAWMMTHRGPSAYLTATVAFADIEQSVLASGTIQPKRLVSVGAQASGRITALHVALGDAVKKGALIAEIDPATEQNALDTAVAVLDADKAQRASAVAARKAAKLAFERATTTVAANAISRADYETAEAGFQEAQAQVESLDAQIRGAAIAVDTARVTLGYTKVLAPLSGTVVAIVTPDGQTVNAVQSAPTLVKIADLDTMTVKAKISEADVPKVRRGMAVYFTILGEPDHRYTATLGAVEPAPESLAAEQPTVVTSSSQNTAVYFNGLFDVPNADHTLRPLMTAEVSIVLRAAHHVPTVPSAALDNLKPDGQALVRTVDDAGKPHRRQVRVGINNGVVAQILDGVHVGETVIVGRSSPSSDSADQQAFRVL